ESPADSPKADVGEIDTRAPFESVKAAVSLFGDVGSPRAIPMTKKTKAEEQRLLEKEAQHHMVLRELQHYRDHLRAEEMAKDQALKDLEKAKITLLELTNNLERISESKQAAIRSAELAKTRAKELEEQKSQLGTDAWKLDVDAEREKYRASSGELIATKQELTNLRQDFDSILQVKLSAFQAEEDALRAARTSRGRANQLSDEVSALRMMLDKVNSDSHRAEEEHLKLIAEKEVHLLVHKSAKQISDEQFGHLKEELENEENLKQRLQEVTEAIDGLQEQLNFVQASDFNALKGIVSELASVKNELEEVVAEEESVKSSVDSLKLESEKTKRERSDWEKKATEAESKLEQIQNELENKKTDLEAANSSTVFEDMKSTLEKLIEETKKKKQETDDTMREVELQRQDAEMARRSAKEGEEKLQIALKMVEEAHAAKKLADEQIHNSPSCDAEAIGGSARKIRLSAEEFKSTIDKIEQCKSEADEKVATIKAHIENLNASEKEVLQKVDAMSKEITNLQSEIEDARKRTEMAEAARKIVEGELQKWHQNEE
ncbi:hypothetical protein M569_00192, partial [Genlisea aurea]